MHALPRILIVEDNFLLAEVLCDFVAECGWQTAGPASDLDKGLSIARQADLDGAILDINLGGRLCFSICDVLAQRGVPFCFVTGYGRLGVIPDRYGTVPVVAKPFEPQELRSIIDTMLHGQTGHGPLPGATTVGSTRARR
jgi:DNA-binding response OmpR family regulator